MTKPRALNVFIDGLAEIGIIKIKIIIIIIIIIMVINNYYGY